MTRANPLITASNLNLTRQNDPPAMLDATWTFAGGPAVKFDDSHGIDWAFRFDIDAIADTSTSLPHMLPSADRFANAMGRADLANDQAAVVYDRIGLFSAPRAWWMLRAFGHNDDLVQVLDGGYGQWAQINGPTTLSRAPYPEPVETYNARRTPRLVASTNDVLAAIDDDTTLVLDARAPERFAGAAAEPRPGLRSGHVPGAINIPWPAVLNHDNTMKSTEALEQVATAAGVDLDTPHLITMCGSGVTSCILNLALARLGRWDVMVYDGSWAEWGARHDLPIATSAE